MARDQVHGLGGPEPSAEEQAVIDAAWADEIGKRIKEVEDGTAELIDGDEFIRSLRRRKKDWRRTIGIFAGDEVMKQIDEEARKIREADRDNQHSE